MLYRSTGCLSRAGAPVKNLSHSAAFHFCMDIPPTIKCRNQTSRLSTFNENWQVLHAHHHLLGDCQQVIARTSRHSKDQVLTVYA
jgi:hypothetical protein